MDDAVERVVLVDREDRELGTAPKLEVHRTGALHRAFSVFVVDGEGRMLLQRRAATKYHTPGLWSNAACGHPRPGEAVGAAAARRLEEEMGFRCDLRSSDVLLYEAELGGGLREHEYDHLFLGRWEGAPAPDPAEVDEWRWTEPDALRRELAESPERFTPWFRMVVPGLLGSGALDPRPATA